MKTIVVFYSLEGNTRAVAEKIAKELNCDILELKPVKAFPDSGVKKFFWGGKSATFKDKPELEPYDVKPEEYDLVVLGTPLWVWNITPPVRTFLTNTNWDKTKVAAFISCGGGDTKKAFQSVKDLTGKDPLVAEVTLVEPLKNEETNQPLIAEFCKTILSVDND